MRLNACWRTEVLHNRRAARLNVGPWPTGDSQAEHLVISVTQASTALGLER